MVTVTWTGNALKMETEIRDSRYAGYPDLDRVCGKLKRRGFKIERVGQGHIRYAVPINPKYGHPKDKMAVGESQQWNV